MSALGVSLWTNVPTRHFDAHSLSLTSDRCLHTIRVMSDISNNVITDRTKLLCSTCSVTIVVQTFNAPQPPCFVFVFFWKVLSSPHSYVLLDISLLALGTQLYFLLAFLHAHV